MASHAPHETLQPLPLIDTVPLMPGLHAELISLLRGLAPDDWERPTVARPWRVRDIAAHLLDTSLRRLSRDRDGHRPPPDRPITSYADIIGFINQLNQSWVTTANRLSPRVITDLLAAIQPQVIETLGTLDLEAPASIPVAWAGHRESPNWFDIGREYTEWWHHQAQIRDAVGAPPLASRALTHPFFELSLMGLPHAYRDAEAEPGSTVSLTIDGEAGGVWSLRRSTAAPDASAGTKTMAEEGATNEAAKAEPAWELLRGDAPRAVTRLRLDADQAWRLLYNALGEPEARRALRVEGEPRLAEPLLAARTVMV